MIEPVSPAALGLLPKRASPLQWLAFTVDLANLTSGHASNERVWWHIFRNHGPRRNHAEVAKPSAAYDRRVRSDGRSLLKN